MKSKIFSASNRIDLQQEMDLFFEKNPYIIVKFMTQSSSITKDFEFGGYKEKIYITILY